MTLHKLKQISKTTRNMNTIFIPADVIFINILIPIVDLNYFSVVLGLI